MSKFAKGKYALAISDRSGQAFPWREMVTEWNGAFVHVSEYEPKQPQLEPKPFVADPQGLEQARPQRFPSDQIGGGNMVANLTLPGDFAFQDFSNNSMVPENPSVINSRREASIALGEVIAGAPITIYAVTVVSTAGGNKYFIDGAQQATLNLTKGQTYQFDQSAGTNGGHPLRLSTTSDGTHSGGVEYTTGVTTNGIPGNTGAYTQIVVDASAPSTLYYYCSVHPGMGGQINIS